MTFTNTTLWRTGFGGQYEESAQVAELRGAYHDLSRLAALLVAEISADLKQYTVHDISHLEALWGIASEIVGPDYQITPTEAFVLGGAFLLHDAGMSLAAYPGGMKDVSAASIWPLIVQRIAKDARNPSSDELNRAVIEFIRLEHANRAGELPNTEWSSPDGVRRTLIENGDIRQKFGQLIGEVAASHWWSHDKVAARLNRIVPSPPPYPSRWSIDLLKVAAILRVADVAHLDERRAPGFLWALRGASLSKESAEHWLFQNRLTQPARRGDAIHYSSTSDFKKSEAEAWWRAYDTLRYVDEELRRTGVLLADLRGEPLVFAARRVADSETPTTLMRSIRVVGWMPIDTSVKVSDVPRLVKNLGGESLYGENRLVAVRELVQNAVDAMKLRSLIQPDRMRTAKIILTVGEEGGRNYLEVEDEGVGMTADIIQNVLLDFGGSGWMRDPLFADYPTRAFRRVETIGKFGIGFFSVFMLGSHVDLVTRRFDQSFSNTLLLKFSEGVGQRPILSAAPQEQWLMEGGTKIRVWLDEDSLLFDEAKYDPWLSHPDPANVCKRLFPALEFPIIFRNGGAETTVDGTGWRNESGEKFLKRVAGVRRLDEVVAKLSGNLRPILNSEGRVVGRMCVCPRDFGSYKLSAARYGAVTVKGVAVTKMSGLLGIIEGRVVRAARDVAFSEVDKGEFLKWLEEQADLLKQSGLSDDDEVEVSSLIVSLEGNPKNLKICRTAEGYLSAPELMEFIRKRNSIAIVTSEIKLNELTTWHEDVVSVGAGTPVVFQTPSNFDATSVWADMASHRELKALFLTLSRRLGVSMKLFYGSCFGHRSKAFIPSMRFR